ncbi:MAG: hypothetical protein HZB16_10115 [Armatimonadetes bacterium]|nr:hypothetical protein [Armatimonadota bacterium]
MPDLNARWVWTVRLLGGLRVEGRHVASLLARQATRRLDLPERQRALRATTAWGHDLLPAPLRRLLCQVSAFRGAFTGAAARAVSGESLAETFLAQRRGYCW